MKNYFGFIFCLLLYVIAQSCTEPYALNTYNDEKTLVIEATITNQFKNHKILISRSFNLQDSDKTHEIGATVYIKDSNNIIYTFDEKTEYYEATTPFAILPNVYYELFVNTSDGINYKSFVETLPSELPFIDNVTTTVKIKDGVRGVSITTKANDDANSSKFYRYEFENTYKIIAPLWSKDSLTVTGNSENNNPPNEIMYEFTTILRNPLSESKTCYKLDKSKEIIVNNTAELTSNSTIELLFLDQMNPKIAHRYSVLAKQYNQTQGANSFYSTLKKITESNGSLSSLQPGFINGNIKSTNSTNKVIGYFDVCSYTEKRIFFNYVDLFPGEPQPPYLKECEILQYDVNQKLSPIFYPPFGLSMLVSHTRSGRVLYYQQQGNLYDMSYTPACGDCRYLGSNARPSFWVD